jgi:hypothetical protein
VKTGDRILVGLMLLLMGFVGYQIMPRLTAVVAETPAETESEALDEGASVEGDVASTSLPAPERDLAAIQATIARSANGTYIGDLLAARDSNIARWIARPAEPVRVWIDERPALEGFDGTFPSQVRRAFADWGNAGVPLTFTFVSDSATAEVNVTWRDRFDAQISGRTRWERDVNWWILAGDIELAVRTPGDRAVTSAQMYAIALHEVGHLLGLDHTRDTLAIMASRVRVYDLTPADIATMRLIYTVPPGSVRFP